MMRECDFVPLDLNSVSHPQSERKLIWAVIVVSTKARVSSKIEAEYRDLTTLPAALQAQQGGPRPQGPPAPSTSQAAAGIKRKLIEGPGAASSDVIEDAASKA